VSYVYVYVCNLSTIMEYCNMKFDKSQVKDAQPVRLTVLPYMEKRDMFIDECVDLADEWRSSHASFIGSKSKRQLRKELKGYISARSDLKSGSLIWTIVAKIVLSWVVEWIINNYIIKSKS
jgi:hypothetical protein